MNAPIKIENLESFKKENPITATVDRYSDLLEELFLVRNPGKKVKSEYKNAFEIFKNDHLAGKSSDDAGQWFYFPWNKMLVHYLSDELHQEVRTARNRNIITKEEQAAIYDATIAVAGLSVGSHAALTIAMMGMSRHIKLADHDEISASNLNRLQYDFTKIGKNKAEAAAEHIYQMNPYAKIDVYSGGLTKENIDEFFTGTDLFIEEMDSLPMKVMSRTKARDAGIPVLMATDNGFGVILDVERYDLDRKYPFFHGRVASLEDTISSNARQTNPKIWNKIASEIIGIDFMEEGLVTSLQGIGRTIGGVPQLGAAAIMSGSILALCAFKILTKKPLASGKYVFSLEATIDPDHESPSAIQRRENARNHFRDFLNS